jgi:hypothetical protein
MIMSHNECAKISWFRCISVSVSVNVSVSVSVSVNTINSRVYMDLYWYYMAKDIKRKEKKKKIEIR